MAAMESITEKSPPPTRKGQHGLFAYSLVISKKYIEKKKQKTNHKERHHLENEQAHWGEMMMKDQVVKKKKTSQSTNEIILPVRPPMLRRMFVARRAAPLSTGPAAPVMRARLRDACDAAADAASAAFVAPLDAACVACDVAELCCRTANGRYSRWTGGDGRRRRTTAREAEVNSITSPSPPRDANTQEHDFC
jgi:hypothetical protein